MSSISKLEEQINRKAEQKLNALCKERFGDLFEMCGGHGEKDPDLKDIEKINQAIKQLYNGIRSDRLPWHGTVFTLAEMVLMSLLRNKYREREVNEFLETIEKVKQITEEQ
jgi:hypothetical protein